MQAYLPVQMHEEQLDMETAWAVGFNALSLSEEEEGLLPEGSNQAIYCKVWLRPPSVQPLCHERERLCHCFSHLRLPCCSASLTLVLFHACRRATTS